MELINEHAAQRPAPAARSGASPEVGSGVDSGLRHFLEHMTGAEDTSAQEQVAHLLIVGALIGLLSLGGRVIYVFQGKEQELLNGPALVMFAVCSLPLFSFPYGRHCLKSTWRVLATAVCDGVRKLCGK